MAVVRGLYAALATISRPAVWVLLCVTVLLALVLITDLLLGGAALDALPCTAIKTVAGIEQSTPCSSP